MEKKKNKLLDNLGKSFYQWLMTTSKDGDQMTDTSEACLIDVYSPMSPGYLYCTS